MQIFLSYASEQKNIAEQLCFGLRNDGHQVFFDRADLPAGGDYNERIRAAIEAAELFVYCVSPESVEEGSYARTELGFALAHFGKAVDRVLPVMVAPTPYEHIPNFAKSVTVLEPNNVVAEVLQAVARLASSRGERYGAWILIGIACVLTVNASFQWARPRLETNWVVALLLVTLLLIAPLAWWYWRRLALSGSRWLQAAPLLLCAVAAGAGWIASSHPPVTLWVLPGSSLMPRIPAEAGRSPFTLEFVLGGERTSAPFDQSGVLIGANSTSIGLATRQAGAALDEAMKAYLVQRHVPPQFHAQYLGRWRAGDSRRVQFSVASQDDIEPLQLRADNDTIATVINVRAGLPLQLLFLEKRP